MPAFWLDGRFGEGEAPERERTGVFDTLLAVRGEPVFYEEHMARLRRDARLVLHREIPVLAGMPLMKDVLAKNGLMAFARVRTSVTPDHVLIEAFSCPDPANLAPLTCAIIDGWPRAAGDKLENCKRLDYSRNFAARDKAQALGADDAILTNTDGNIACGATANIFIEENGSLITPPLADGVLAGITRATLIARGAREESISRERLWAADAVYLTNSIFGKRRVARLLP